MTLRDEKVSEFETTLANVRFVGVNSFLEQFPDEKEELKRFKKDVETYKYASDEHIETYHDKALGEIKMERPDYILSNLQKRNYALEVKVRTVLRRKREADEKEERLKKAEKALKRAEERATRTAQLLVDEGILLPTEYEDKKRELFLREKYGA